MQNLLELLKQIGLTGDKGQERDMSALTSPAAPAPAPAPELPPMFDPLAGGMSEERMSVAPTPAIKPPPAPARMPAAQPAQPVDKKALVENYIKKQYGFGEGLDDSALKAEQAKAAETRKLAQWGEAMDQIGRGISGATTPVDPSFWRNQSKDAGQGVTDIETRRKGMVENQKFGEEQELRDPSGQRNVAYRSWLKQFLPGVAKNPSFESVTLADSGVMQKFADMYMRSEDRKASLAQTAMFRQLAEGNRQHEKDQLQTRWEEGKIKDHAEDLSKTGLPDALTKLQELDALLEGGLDEASDVPGYGRLEGLKPDWMIGSGSKAERVRNLVQGLANVQLKDRSGANVTDPEMERFKKEYGTGTFTPDSKLLSSLRTYRDALKAKIGGYEAGLPPKVLQRYKERPSAIKAEQVPGGPRKSAPSQDAIKKALEAGYSPDEIKEYLRGKP